MRFILSVTVFFGLMSCLAAFSDLRGEPDTGSGAEPVPFELFGYPYFVKNTISPPEGESALVLEIGTPDRFGETFGIGMVMGKRPNLIGAGYFETHEVAAFIEWGPTPWEYTVRSAVRTGNEIVFRITRTGTPSPSAVFAPHLILGLGRESLEGVETITFELVPEDTPADGPRETFSVSR